jgi:MFS family permease
VALGAALAALEMLAAAVPGEVLFWVLLLLIGACTLLLLTSANSTVQMAAHDGIRGRVMGVYLLVFIGGAAIGGPLLGLVDQHFGPRAGLLLAGGVSAAAAMAIAARLARAARPAAPARPARDSLAGVTRR